MKRFLSCQFTLLLSLLTLAASAQTNPNSNPNPPPQQQNPLMQLMLSQPSVDINSPIVIKAEFDPPVIKPGEKCIYRVSLNGLEASVNWPQQMPIPPGLKMTAGGRGQVFQPMGTVLRPLTALNFHTRAERAGLFTVPGFFIEVYGKPVRVPEAYLEVSPTTEDDHQFARQLILIPEQTNVFVGQPLRVRVLSPGVISNVVDTLTQLQFNGDGFLPEKTELRQDIQRYDNHGKIVSAFAIETSLTPISSGQQTVTAQAFTAGMHVLGPVVFSGQMTLPTLRQYLLLDSDPISINVRPLPPQDANSGFNGFIGRLTAERQISTNSLRVGDAIRLLVTFRSDNSLARLTPPQPPNAPGWQIFPAMPVDTPPSATPATNNTITYAYTLLPLTEEVRETPAIPFSAFDPDKAAYTDLSIAPLGVSVSAEGLPTDWKVSSHTTTDNKREQKLALSKLAESPGITVGSLTPLQTQRGFFLVQLAPALALLALGAWARRRRYLEQHPEIVRCRQARRALRRQKRALRHAAASRDAQGFARNGVAALQIAAAPHFPATPRALVSSDVLNLFPESERGGRTGQVISSFFAHDQAEAFAPKRESQEPLFDLHPDLEHILEKMEARL